MIFITGINGLVGSHLAKRLVQNGYPVGGLCRAGANKELLKDIEHQIKFFEGSINDVSILNQAMQEAKIVVHTAAIISFSPYRRLEMMKTNIEGTANVVNAALLHKIDKLIHISSIAALGRKADSIEITENTKWEDSNLNSAYAFSKYMADLEVRRGIEEGLMATILHPSVILGGGILHNGSTQLFDYVLKGHKIYTDGLLNYVDVEDVCTAALKTIQKDYSSEAFILNGGHCSYQYFFEEIAKQAHIKAPHIKAGRILLEIGWRLMAVWSFFTRKEPLLSKETANISKNHFVYNASKSEKVLSVQYTSLQNTIQRSLEDIKKRA
jgi:nucleoside-diphosphate-sugar epimerase